MMCNEQAYSLAVEKLLNIEVPIRAKYIRGKCLYNPYPNEPLLLTCLQIKVFENTVEKEQIAHKEQFLLFPKC